jgi:YVTN family beta-propeller protein
MFDVPFVNTRPGEQAADGPTGVAVDAARKIYVTNYYNNILTTYKANGTQTTTTITGLNEPEGVAVH